MSYFRKSASTLATQVLKIFIGLCSSVIVARSLGPQLNGQVAVLTTALTLLFMTGNLGLGSAFSYYIAKGDESASDIVRLSFVSSLSLGLLMVGVFFLTYPLHSTLWADIPFSAVVLCIFLTPINTLQNFLLRVMQGFNRIYAMNVGDALSSLLNLVSMAACVWYLRLEVNGYLLALYVSTVGSVALLSSFLRREVTVARTLNWNLLGTCFRYGVRTYPLLLLNFLNYRIDMFILNHYRGALEVGYYSLAVGIAELIWLIPNSFMNALFPAIASSREADRSQLTLETCRWTLPMLLAIATCLVIGGREAIWLLYGRAFAPSYWPLLAILPGIVLFPVYRLLVVDLAARGHPGYGTIASLMALTVNVGANLVLIPRFGAVGAGVASSISYSLMSMVSLYFFVSFTKHSAREVFVIPVEEWRSVGRKLRSLTGKTH